jgi:hypothetical protein
MRRFVGTRNVLFWPSSKKKYWLVNLKISLSVPVPDAQTNSPSFQKTADVTRHVVVSPVCHSKPPWPCRKCHLKTSQQRSSGVLHKNPWTVSMQPPPPLPPGRCYQLGPSNCGLSGSFVISKAGFPRILFFCSTTQNQLWNRPSRSQSTGRNASNSGNTVWIR